MGQNSSSLPTSGSGGDTADHPQFSGRLGAQLNVLMSLATVTYAQVVHSIEELNSVTKSFTDRSGKQLRFVIRKGTDATFLWKGTIRIRCLKINTRSDVIESSRLLNLHQFVVLYKEIIDQVSMLSPHPGSHGTAQTGGEGSHSLRTELDQEGLCASKFFTEADLCASQGDLITECCVCMDHKACVMLSCCHEFCEECIDSWTSDARHRNCPLCRKNVAGSDDTWVLTDRADTTEYERELKGYLVGLADRTGSKS